jgi:Zn-dependent membrane protease YugP
LRALESGAILEIDEMKGAKKVLVAAALTYVAGLLTAVMQIFYYASRFKPRD